jgi:hypothetical protein
MPLDGKGKFHLNSQQASSHDKMGGAPQPTDGEPNEAPSPVHEHLQALHAAMGGKHMHIHSDGMDHTSHQIGEDGQVEGPHDHANIEALKEHMGKFFDEEEQEGGPEEKGERGYGGSKESKDHASLYL